MARTASTAVVSALQAVRDSGRETAEVLCPSCGGGKRERRTLSVSIRPDGLALYCCHRASCGIKGVYAVGAVDDRQTRAAFEPRPLTAPYRIPTPADAVGADIIRRGGCGPSVDELTRWCLTHGLRVLTQVPTTRVWQLTDAEGIQTGHITRTAAKRISTWRDVDRPHYGVWHWPHGSFPRDVIIVEDPLSAALLGRPSVALLGTHMTPSVRDAILRASALTTRFQVALDPDAFEGPAIRVMNSLLGAGRSCNRLWIEKDIKDMTRDEREKVGR